MFMDQLCSLDGQYLLTWKEIQSQMNIKFKGRKPGWFRHIEDNLTISNYRTLIEPIKDPQVFSLNYKHPPQATAFRLTSEWTFHWNPSVNTIVYGKSIERIHNKSTSITYAVHYVPYNDSSPNHRQNSSPHNSVNPFLIPCSGVNCRLNSYYPYNHNYKCVLTLKNSLIYIVKSHRKNRNPHADPLRCYPAPKLFFFLTKPLDSLKCIAYNLFLFQNSTTFSSLPPTTHVDLLERPSTISKDQKLITDCIIGTTQEKTKLISHLNQIQQYDNFVFYSDGSLKDISLPTCRLGFGWIQTRRSIPDISYYGTTLFLPSSTKAEAFAILTILLVCPSRSSVKIMTDSENCIKTF